MIRLENVTKQYASVSLRGGRQLVTALEDVTLDLEEGRLWGVVGPNGAGKTTLFGLVLGFLFPDRGDVSVRGGDPRGYVRGRGAAYLPERFQPPGDWTVRGALRALARLERLRRGADARVSEVLEQLELSPHAGKKVRELSRGLLQRLGIAQALLADRELVVLDEPSDGLDPLWRIRFRAILDELKRGGRTILLASHDLPEVERHADAVVLLEGGRVHDVLRLGARAGEPRTYRVLLAAPTPAFSEVFPGARAAEDALSYDVDVADEVELSARMAALLDAGGIIAAVAPAGVGLEERVRQAVRREER